MIAFTFARRSLALIGAVAALMAVPAHADQGQITLIKGALLRDGRPWIVKGVKLTSRLVPPKVIDRPLINPHLRESQALWSSALPLRIRAYGADTAVISVSQPGLDPQHPIHDPQYRDEVVSAINALRQAGLTVVISMQWENGAGAPKQPDLPGDSTLSAWRALLQALPADDAGLVFEVLNEPMPIKTFTPQIPADLWANWKSAHETVIAAIRAAGFHRQVVVVGGLDGAHRLDQAPDVTDPDHRLAYGIHPYLNAGNLEFDTAAGWDRYFGDFCQHHACMITEFGLARRPGDAGTACKGDAPQVFARLLAYAWTRRIGMVGWAYDYPWTLNQGPDYTTPTNFKTWAGTCEASTMPYGIGQMLTDWYHSH
ncbi:glycoside hydrolase family 5 protein [Novosphingobium sp. FSW06-99]|uniref:glycoside hydrolase family 5 protein n=1 Tax=Novosphingobium sp. FSW06-99 TaxID=1739113 RepID=UPI00076D18CE|nr:cellulase family glycosylhydrolase [Novosphingobium sp. FSW06-99]KUR76846.1 hypothetical protein AQZ49_10995 [Novosphingobium sp. FSW06-99]